MFKTYTTRRTAIRLALAVVLTVAAVALGECLPFAVVIGYGIATLVA